MQCFGGCFAADKDGKAAKLETADGLSKSASGSSKPKLRLLSSSKKQMSGPTYTPTSDSSKEDREQLRQKYLMQHGQHILGISTLQQEQLQHFVMPGIGYIAFAWMRLTSSLQEQQAVGLSDPVCAPEHRRTMAEAFLREHPEGIFVQASFEFAAILQQMGFRCNSMGGETRLDIATYNFAGYARRGLRSAISAAQKDGLTVEEVMQPAADTFGSGAARGAGASADKAAGTDWGKVTQEMQGVDAEWAIGKGGRAHEVWFINRPPVFAPEAGVRKFVARNAAGVMQGYIFFDGVYEGGQLVGYYANVTRLLPDAHPGTLNLIIKEFLERVRAEAKMGAPAKKLSMRKSQRKKLEAAMAAAEAAVAADAADTTTDAADAAPGGKDQTKQKKGSTQKQQQQQQQEMPDQAAAAAAPASGPTFLSLGLSPFYQMNNKPVPKWKSCTLTYLLLLLCYEDGAGFYPFKTLAAAKAKYGAGLHSFKYEDPNVEYKNAFLCHRFKNPYVVFWRMFDLAALYGFWQGVGDCFGRYFEYKGKQGAEFMVRTLKRATKLESYKLKKKNKKQLRKSKSCTSSCSSKRSSASATSSSNSATASSGEGMARCKSAPAGVCGSSGKAAKAAKSAAAAPAAGVSLSATAAAPAAAAAAATAAAAAAAHGSHAPSKVLISAPERPAVVATELSTSVNSECLSDSASYVSAHTDTAIFVADQSGPHSPAHSHAAGKGGHMGGRLSSEISTC